MQSVRMHRVQLFAPTVRRLSGGESELLLFYWFHYGKAITGDCSLASKVTKPTKMIHVIYFGLRETSEFEGLQSRLESEGLNLLVAIRGSNSNAIGLVVRQLCNVF